MNMARVSTGDTHYTHTLNMREAVMVKETCRAGEAETATENRMVWMSME